MKLTSIELQIIERLLSNRLNADLGMQQKYYLDEN